MDMVAVSPNGTDEPSTSKYDMDPHTTPPDDVFLGFIPKTADGIFGFVIFIIFAIFTLVCVLPLAMTNVRYLYPKIRRNHPGLLLLTMLLFAILSLAAPPMMWIVAIIIEIIRCCSKRSTARRRRDEERGNRTTTTTAITGLRQQSIQRGTPATRSRPTTSSTGERSNKLPPSYSNITLPLPTYSSLSVNRAQQISVVPDTSCICAPPRYQVRDNRTTRPRQTTCHCVPVDHHPELFPEYPGLASELRHSEPLPAYQAFAQGDQRLV
ncbi:hypothetical protein V8F33_002206 [Rhypophila sp. PSN 637]